MDIGIKSLLRACCVAHLRLAAVFGREYEEQTQGEYDGKIAKRHVKI